MQTPPRREDGSQVRRPRVIPADNVAYVNPGRQPLGRVPELRDARGFDHAAQTTPARDAWGDDTEQPDRLRDIRPRYSQERDADRRAASLDTDTPVKAGKPRKKRRKKKDPHRGLWLCVVIVCAVLLVGMAVFMTPQLLGVTWSGLPNFAFMNGAIMQMNQVDYADYRAYRQYMADDVIFPSVYVDDVHVGGMTLSEARTALENVHNDHVGTFGITVNVADQSWLIDSTRVPMTRNYDLILEQAYAKGRVNTTVIRGTGVTPFQERLNVALALRSSPVSLYTSMTYDKETVRALVNSIKAAVDTEPINATVAAFNFNTKEFTFTEDVSGRRLDGDAIYDQVVACLDGGDLFATITAVPESLLAETTRTELMNSFKMVASYTTETTSNSNRNTNIDLSAQAINGVTILPGETFSFNKATGERTSAKGYQEAIAISGGQSVPDIGGGVCQTSSTLFNAAARANLEIVSRSPHAWPSSYVEKGMDATVNWPGLDFCFKNNTDWPVFIVSWYANRKITVELYGIGLGDGVTIDLQSVVTKTIPISSGQNRVLDTSLASGTEKVTIKARAGYEVETYKVWYKNGEETNRELLCKSTYRAYQETVAYNN